MNPSDACVGLIRVDCAGSVHNLFSSGVSEQGIANVGSALSQTCAVVKPVSLPNKITAVTPTSANLRGPYFIVKINLSLPSPHVYLFAHWLHGVIKNWYPRENFQSIVVEISTKPKKPNKPQKTQQKQRQETEAKKAVLLEFKSVIDIGMSWMYEWNSRRWWEWWGVGVWGGARRVVENLKIWKFENLQIFVLQFENLQDSGKFGGGNIRRHRFRISIGIVLVTHQSSLMTFIVDDDDRHSLVMMMITTVCSLSQISTF